MRSFPDQWASAGGGLDRLPQSVVRGPLKAGQKAVADGLMTVLKER
jgi:hypothetical protein